jgi:exodeoxyribonuclease I
MAEPTFFFYDLETSGREPRRHRIIQFAGQRTDADFNRIGEPVNIVVRLDREIIPEPMAVLITGITPQYTVEYGISEREAIARIMQEICLPDTIIVGFNNVRFDDEFLRFTAYRNFHDPYEWAWADGRSRWDMLDVVRLVRALRPEGIEWPVDEEGMPVTKLEALARANGLSLEHAHDALSDVDSLIDVTKLLRHAQPKMFEYLLKLRGKKEVARLLETDEPFVYSSGMYGRENMFTTVALPIGSGRNGSVIAFDLRQDLAAYASMSGAELKELRYMKKEEREARGLPPFPAKDLHCNKCPAVAAYAALRDEDAGRLGLDKGVIAERVASLRSGDLPVRLAEAFKDDRVYENEDVEDALYDGFFTDYDKRLVVQVRNASLAELDSLKPAFRDARLPELFLRYKARNAPDSLSVSEREVWERYLAIKNQNDKAGFEIDAQELEPSELVDDLRKWLST